MPSARRRKLRERTPALHNPPAWLRLSVGRQLATATIERIAASLSEADLHLAVMGAPLVGLVQPSKIDHKLAVPAPVLYIGPDLLFHVHRALARHVLHVKPTRCINSSGPRIKSGNSMAYTKDNIGSIGELLEKLRGVCKNRPGVWFRGQAVSKWKLQPSIMRPPHSPNNEVVLLKKFKQNAVPLIDVAPTREDDWLFLMQHHDVPTRLLDWSESPLVALYFAVGDPKASEHKRKDGALWCLYPHVLNELAGIHMQPEHDIPSFGHEDYLLDYLPSRAKGITTASRKPVALIAPRPFRRLHVQQGVFTIFHHNLTPLEDLTDKEGKQDHIVKFIIPSAAKSKIRKELLLLQIDRLALFPELENVAARIAINLK
jgi:hypothetical protein